MRMGVEIVTVPGQVAAEGYIEQALHNNPSYAGCVVHANDKLNITRIKGPDLNTMKKICTGMKDFRLSLHLSNSLDKGFIEADMQPYVLLGDDANPILAVTLEGDWAIQPPVDTKHSDEFFVAMNQLRPLFLQLQRLTKNDLPSMLEELDGEATKTSILNMMTNRGVVHLMFNNGDVRTIEKNELSKQFPWGWVSNHYAYSEDKKPEPKVEPPIPTNPFEALLASPTTPVTPPATLPPTPTVVEPEKPKEAEVLPPVPSGSGKQGRPAVGTKWSCPTEIKKPHKVESAYRHNAGFVPTNYMEYPEVIVREPQVKGPTVKPVVVNDLKSLGEAVKETATRILPDVKSTPSDIATRTPPPATGPKIMPPVQDLPKPEPAALPVQPTPATTNAPVMSPLTQSKIVDHWLKETEKMVITKDRSGNDITDPRKVPHLEDKHTSFAERVGIPFETIFRWKTERLEKLIYDHPDAALHLLCDMRVRLAEELLAKAADAGKKIMPKLGKTG